MLWLRTPEKVYFKRGCMPVALDELGTIMHKKRAFIVTDTFLYKNGYTKPITDKLDQMGIVYSCFYDVEPDPKLKCAKAGAEQMRSFGPDTIIALGGGSAMDAAKIMWVMYEHPEVEFHGHGNGFHGYPQESVYLPEDGGKSVFRGNSHLRRNRLRGNAVCHHH